MRSKLLVFAAFASLLAAAPAVAADQSGGSRYGYGDAVAVLLSLDQPEARQNAVVRFWKPVRVGDLILMGKYIIEHDTDRMASGRPCTHIYDFYSRKLVIAFHCEHLTRPRTGDLGTVTIQSRGDAVAQLREFQFAGEIDAHGVPGR